MSSVEENIFLARVAEQAERFEDMVEFLSKVLDTKGPEVTSDERNLLSVAFKNLISSKRAACRTIAAIEQNPSMPSMLALLQATKLQLKAFIEKNSSDNFADGQVVLQDKSSRKTTSLRELLRIRSFLSRAKSEVSNLSPDLPILVLHGSADKIISLRGSELLVNHATSSKKKTGSLLRSRPLTS